MKRRKFLSKFSTGGLTVGAACSLSVLHGRQSDGINKSKGVKIVPIEGFDYPPGFLNFITGKEFSSAQSAVMAVRNPDLPFVLEPLSKFS